MRDTARAGVLHFSNHTQLLFAGAVLGGEDRHGDNLPQTGAFSMKKTRIGSVLLWAALAASALACGGPRPRAAGDPFGGVLQIPPAPGAATQMRGEEGEPLPAEYLVMPAIRKD